MNSEKNKKNHKIKRKVNKTLTGLMRLRQVTGNVNLALQKIKAITSTSINNNAVPSRRLELHVPAQGGLKFHTSSSFLFSRDGALVGKTD